MEVRKDFQMLQHLDICGSKAPPTCFNHHKSEATVSTAPHGNDLLKQSAARLCVVLVSRTEDGRLGVPRAPAHRLHWHWMDAATNVKKPVLHRRRG